MGHSVVDRRGRVLNLENKLVWKFLTDFKWLNNQGNIQKPIRSLNRIIRHCLRHVVTRSSQGNKVSGYTKMSKHLVKGLKYETIQSIPERIFFLTSMKPGNNEIISKTLFANFFKAIQMPSKRNWFLMSCFLSWSINPGN